MQTRQKFQKLNKKHSANSASWLTRHINDPYVLRSKMDGYRCRAAYKLQQINEKFGLIKPDSVVVDLGAAPGGWSQVARELLEEGGAVFALDLLPMEPIAGVNFIQADFLQDQWQDQWDLSKGVDVVLSDIAPNTTGHKATDHIKIIAICTHVFEFSLKVLKPGGALVMKIFQGGTQHQLLHRIKQEFSQIKHYKPDASRKESTEMYMVALNRKAKT